MAEIEASHLSSGEDHLCPAVSLLSCISSTLTEYETGTFTDSRRILILIQVNIWLTGRLLIYIISRIYTLILQCVRLVDYLEGLLSEALTRTVVEPLKELHKQLG